MRIIDRQLPMLSWLPKAKEAGFLPEKPFSKFSETRDVYRSAKQLQIPILKNAENQPDIAALQFQMGRPRNMRFLPLDRDIDGQPLAKNEVLFVPQSFGANRYLTYYSGGYILQDIGTFVDPKGVHNTKAFKTAPCWGRCKVHRSNHPQIEAGSTYYGFWPLAAYSVRSVCDVDPESFIAYQDVPHFTGPKEWLKLIQMNGTESSFAIDNYEYMKIGITYARELQDSNYFGAQRLVISSASSATGQIVSMCLKELNPSFTVIGLTSERNCGFVKQFPYFDEVHSYDDVEASPNANKSLYFDALGWESVTQDVFDHFDISRWWIYGEGGERTFLKYLKKNRKGSFYSNLADSYVYQIRNGITDAEMLEQCDKLIQKYDLEKRWYTGARVISSSKELFDLYHAYMENSHTGEKMIYRSPLYGS
jgi:hypothetical protein